MVKQLELKNLHKTFAQGTVNEHTVMNGLNLTVNEGDFITVIGGNGAGKSTLMNLIAGVLKPDAGEIWMKEQQLTNDSVEKRSKWIARVFQDTTQGTASRLTIEQNLALALKRGEKRGLGWGVKDADRNRFKEALQELDLGLEERMKTTVEFLSGGQRQALTLVMATLKKPELLLLDEHTAALDPKTSEMVMNLTDKVVQRQKITTIMITHNMEQAIQYGNRLLMLNHGQIVADIQGEEKQKLTVPALLELFKQQDPTFVTQDDALLG